MTVDGVDLVDGSDTETLNSGLWPDRVDEVHSFEVLDPTTSEIRTITMESAQINTDAVPEDANLRYRLGPVGYLLFTDHISDSRATAGRCDNRNARLKRYRLNP